MLGRLARSHEGREGTAIADNIELNPATGGAVVATDQIGTQHHQSVKVTLGANGVDNGFVGTANPMPTATTPTRGTFTNRSGSITTGATAQTLAAVNATRNYLFIQNLSADTLWVNFTTTAVQGQPSIRLAPDAVLEQPAGGFLSTELVSIIGPTTGAKFSAKEAG